MKSKKLSEAIIKTFESNGFVLSEPDVLLDSDYIIERSGEKFRNSMLTFEREDGKTMCLRPDLTVASCISFLQKKSSSKIYYSGQAYRRSNKKGSNFINDQLGIEILGSKNEIQDDTNFSKFEPIVLSLYPDKKINSNVINFETDELILLDGHHRWKYANRTDSVNKLKCILVNFDDIKIKSYFFRLNVKKEDFENLLIQYGFEEIENKRLGIKFTDTYYSNPKHESISQLYKFKKI